MSSGLRHSFTPSIAQPAHAVLRSTKSPPNLPVHEPYADEIYGLAHTVRSKLSRHAALADRDIRLIVHHANLFDKLMYDLINAERSPAYDVSRAADHNPQETKPSRGASRFETDREVVVEESVAEECDDDESDDDLSLSYTSSHSSPELVDSDSESDPDDESLPSSPLQQDLLPEYISEKLKHPIAAIPSYRSSFQKTNHGFIVSKASPHVAIAAS